jgi:hypothetical protein
MLDDGQHYRLFPQLLQPRPWRWSVCLAAPGTGADAVLPAVLSAAVLRPVRKHGGAADDANDADRSVLPITA